jgi:hypothetical protein
MVLLHTHEIHLSAAAVDESWSRHAKDGVVKLAAPAQRGVAAAIADLWGEIKTKRGRDADSRSAYTYWYWQYNTSVPYETVEAVPAGLRNRLEELRLRLAEDSRVVAVIPEE